MIDNEGKEVPGARGYKYFGRARDLPGVRELFEQEASGPVGRSRTEIYKNIDADYYGYRDEEDGILLASEEQQEALLVERLTKQLADGVDGPMDGDQEMKTDEIEAA
ncbi:unnamed protein product [Absidia cylindrospora]